MNTLIGNGLLFNLVYVHGKYFDMAHVKRTPNRSAHGNSVPGKTLGWNRIK